MNTTAPQFVDFKEMIARKKIGAKADNWKIVSWELIGDHETSNDYLIVIGECRKVERGQRKGSLTWRDSKGKRLPHDKAVVTDIEIQTARLHYEAETGNCSICAGSGQNWAGWSAVEGNRYDTCKRCSGTGKSTQPINN